MYGNILVSTIYSISVRALSVRAWEECFIVLLEVFFFCIDVYLYTMTEGIQQSTTNDSPVWVPDSDAKTCMHCRKSEFTVVNRRVSLKPGFDTQ